MSPRGQPFQPQLIIEDLSGKNLISCGPKVGRNRVGEDVEWKLSFVYEIGFPSLPYLIRSNFIKTTYDISLDSQISFLPLGFSPRFTMRPNNEIITWWIKELISCVVKVTASQDIGCERHLATNLHKEINNASRPYDGWIFYFLDVRPQESIRQTSLEK